MVGGERPKADHVGFLGRTVEMWTILSGAFGRAAVRAWIAHIPTAPSGRGIEGPSSGFRRP